MQVKVDDDRSVNIMLEVRYAIRQSSHPGGHTMHSADNHIVDIAKPRRCILTTMMSRRPNSTESFVNRKSGR